MTTQASRGRSAASADSILNAMVEDVANALQAGEPVDLEAIAGGDAGRAELLRHLLPAIAMMADLGKTLAPADAPAADLVAPDVLGDYRIVRELGRGGMGVVYEAEQVSLGRRVALKVLPRASAEDPRHLTRFRVEIQAAAQLDHPHIVPVFAFGCEQGLNYYAMQYVEGPSLARVIAELRSPGRMPAWDRSSFRTVAHLGAQAAGALEHAHQRGIVHRDVKPANLLVDARGHLWVADFGLARLRDGADLTLSGDVMGTLRYMSPEQASGERAAIDHRTDVYSLGATLYEMLTLRPAFDGPDPRTILRRVVLEEPRPPRRVDPEVPRDLETIVLKAMSKEVASRYATAQELGDDLRRFLADEPISARRPSPSERAARWAKRHRAAVAAAGVVLVAAALLGAALLWREKAKTEAALVVAQEARGRERIALRFTFLASDRIAAEALAKLAATGPVAGRDAAFCRQALDYYEEIARRYRDDREMRELAAAASHRVGFLRAALREPGAEAAYRRSVALYEAEASEAGPDPRTLLEMALAYDDLGRFLQATCGLDDASPSFRRSLEVLRHLADAATDPAGPLLSYAYHQLEFADSLEAAGRCRQADEARRLLGDRLDRLAKIAPDDARLLNNLAWLAAKSPRATPAEAGLAVALAEKAVALAPQERAYRNTLGVAKFRAGDWKGASAALDESMRLHGGGDAHDWAFLAMIHHRLGDDDAARRWLDRAVGWIDAQAPADDDLRRFRDEARRMIGPPPP